MMNAIIERLLFAVILSATFAAGIAAFIAGNRRYVRSRLGRNQLGGIVDSANPTVVYFWSANCSQCVPQEHQIEKAQAELRRTGKGFAIRKIDALAEKELAKSMHVLTVPTTVLVNPDGKIVAWNPGFARSEKIVNQFIQSRMPSRDHSIAK
jgi:thioredoxin-like negative regulator of GroEL